MLSNWASYLVSAVVGFLLTPIIVHSLGATGYGLWTLVLSITGYFGLLDLGIRTSVSRFLTRHLAFHDYVGVNKTTSTAFFLLGCGGVLALIGTSAVALLLLGSFQIDAEHASVARQALFITGLNIACILPLGVFSAVLYGSERFDIVSGVTIASELLRAGLIVWLLSHGYGLIGLAALALAITLGQYLLFAICAKRLHPRLALDYRLVDRGVARELFGFSIFRFVWIVANQLIFYSDAVVIGMFLGAGAITPFAIATTLLNYGRNIVFLLMDPLFASAARLDAKGNLAELRHLLIVGTRVALIVALPLCLGFIFLGRQFITLWMGDTYASSAVFLAVLAIPQFVSMPQYVSTLFLTAVDRHRPLAFIALAEGLANVVLSVYLVRKFGLMGVAWGTVIPALITNGVILPLYTVRILELGLKDYVTQAYVRPIACAVPVAILAYALSKLNAGSWLWFAAEGLALCGVFGVLSYFVCLYSEQRAAVTARLWALFRQPAASV